MNYIIFVVLWGISQADAQTLTAEVAAAHRTIDSNNNDIMLAIKGLDPFTAKAVLENSKTSFIAVVEDFVNTLPESGDTQVNSFTADLREQLLESVETMFKIDYGEKGAQNNRRQFQQALKAYINVTASTFDLYKVDANSDAQLTMENLVKRAISEALSATNNLKTTLNPTPSQ